MSIPYTAPSFKLEAFNCPFCGAYSNQIWFMAGRNEIEFLEKKQFISERADGYNDDISFTECTHCEKSTIWVGKRNIYPYEGSAPLPNSDMPDDVKQDFEEARTILTASPRGAAALLRLAVQKLLKHLGASGKHIDSDIAMLVKNGLPEKIQQALDSVRVVGNSAVHPGQIDLNDNSQMASALFGLINFIVNNQITQPKEVADFYKTLPTGAIQAIQNRDTPKPPKIK